MLTASAVTVPPSPAAPIPRLFTFSRTSSSIALIEGAVNAIVSAVREAGPNACPPVVVGVGIGGTFEKAALMAKQEYYLLYFL